MTWKPEIESGCVMNGCLPATDSDREIEESLQLSAQSISYQTLWESGNMPVIRWDSDFEEFLKWQSELHDELRENRIQCVLPWEVLKALPSDRKKSDRLYWSQGGIGSCMGHGDCFAGHSATLTQMALGSPLIYTPCNPVVTWALSKGGSLSGGQSVAPMAKWANEAGHFPESLVGTNNQSMPANWREHQTAASNTSGESRLSPKMSALEFQGFVGSFELEDNTVFEIGDFLVSESYLTLVVEKGGYGSSVKCTPFWPICGSHLLGRTHDGSVRLKSLSRNRLSSSRRGT